MLRAAPVIACLAFLPLLLSGCTMSSRSGASAGASASAGKGVPAISLTSTAKQIGAYVAYYRARGYTITVDQQSYRSDGEVNTFRFTASRRTASGQAGASASISAATQTVSTSVSVSTGTPQGGVPPASMS